MDDCERNMHLRELHAPSGSTSTNWPSKAPTHEKPPDQSHNPLHSTPRASATHHENAITPLPTARDDETTANPPPAPTKTSTHLHTTRQRLGLHPSAPILESHDLAAHSAWWWPKLRMTLKEPLAEFFGVFIMVLFGDGSVAQVLLSHGSALKPSTAPGGDGFGSYHSINWGWGLGVMLGVYVAGDSGAYLNPAVCLTNTLLRKLPWRRLPLYLLAQFLGGFLAAAIIYLNYLNGINAFEGSPTLRTVPPAPNATAGIFCTYPAADMTRASQFGSEFIASAILMFVIFALKDDSNQGQFSASGEWFPLGLFFLIFGIGCAFGWETGYAINLARDLGPRVMSWALGYGREVWSSGGYYFWIPAFVPFAGCLFGGIVYDVFIYTGPSPINTPWFGLRELVKPRRAVAERVRQQKEEGLVYSLGGTEEHLKTVFDTQALESDRWRPPHVSIANDEDMHIRLGDKAYEHAFLIYFDQRLKELNGDWKALMQYYLLSSSKPLLSGTVGGFAHPLILFADAIDLASPKVVVEALAMLAVDYNQLHLLLDKSATPPIEATPVLDLLERIRIDTRFDGLLHTPGVGDTTTILKSETARNAALEHLDSYAATSNSASKALLELALTATLLLCAVDPPNGKHEFDMYLTHQLTFVWSIRVLIAALPSTATHNLLRAVWLMMVLTYITQLRPPIVHKRVSQTALPPRITDAEWKRLKSVALGNTHDPHYTKVIRTLGEFATLWPENEALFLNACILFEHDFAGWKGFDVAPEH
ncbi:hypothetical protein LTR08_007577 [Meristemomyces frigidus]|nr:hypothetical protein LTR08_007577 [Meristemomyces frigidus]